MTCPHNWTVSSECPKCLRLMLDDAKRQLNSAWLKYSEERVEWAYKERDDALAQLAHATARGISVPQGVGFPRVRIPIPGVDVTDDDRAAARLLSWARVYDPRKPPGTPDRVRWAIGGLDLTFDPDRATATLAEVEALLAFCFAEYRTKIQRDTEVRHGR